MGETAEPVDAEGQLDLLDEVFRAIDEAHRLGLELSAREGVVRRYAEEIHGVATALGVNMEEHSLGDVAALLFAQHQEARNEAQRQEQLSAQLGRERLALEKADHDAEIKTRELADLCLAAGVAEVGELAPVEECAGRKRERSLELSQIEKQLIEQNSVSLDRVLAEAACVDRDSSPCASVPWTERLRMPKRRGSPSRSGFAMRKWRCKRSMEAPKLRKLPKPFKNCWRDSGKQPRITLGLRSRRS